MIFILLVFAQSVAFGLASCDGGCADTKTTSKPELRRKHFSVETPVAHCLSEQFREIGHGIDCFYICKSIRKLASCGIA